MSPKPTITPFSRLYFTTSEISASLTRGSVQNYMGFFRVHEKTPIPESSIQQGIITIYQTVPPILQARLSLYDRLFDSDAVFTDNVRKIVRSQPDGCRVVIRVNADHSPDKFRIDINAHFPRAAVHHHERAYGTGSQPENIPQLLRRCERKRAQSMPPAPLYPPVKLRFAFFRSFVSEKNNGL